MYSKCIGCHASLGRNEVLEAFPVGRRLAFDPERGRVWALCRVCRQWNLTPLEERWEAVEGAERLFESAAIGARTDNVALGRVADGTELIRIGRVERPELAAWRYGQNFLRRWRRTMWTSAGTGVVAATQPFLFAAPIALGALGGVHLVRGRRPIMRSASGQVIRRGDGSQARLEADPNHDSWQLALPGRGSDDLLLHGDEAILALRRLLPWLNTGGGNRGQVRNATDEIVRLGNFREVLRLTAIELEDTSTMHGMPWAKRPGRIAVGHPILRLALEMAVNEETERRALEGELVLLEREWREAEELAAIADDLLFPPHLRQRLGQLRDAASPRRRSGS